MKPSFTASLLVFFIGYLSACSNSPAPISSLSYPTVPEGFPTAQINTDEWIGRWYGPEGTYLEISGAQGQYKVTVQNLDGPAIYQATGKDGAIIFERNGITETIIAGTGRKTGMKWLADKSDCLVIRNGEGFCRD